MSAVVTFLPPILSLCGKRGWRQTCIQNSKHVAVFSSQQRMGRILPSLSLSPLCIFLATKTDEKEREGDGPSNEPVVLHLNCHSSSSSPSGYLGLAYFGSDEVSIAGRRCVISWWRKKRRKTFPSKRAACPFCHPKKKKYFCRIIQGAFVPGAKSRRRSHFEPSFESLKTNLAFPFHFSLPSRLECTWQFSVLFLSLSLSLVGLRSHLRDLEWLQLFPPVNNMPKVGNGRIFWHRHRQFHFSVSKCSNWNFPLCTQSLNDEEAWHVLCGFIPESICKWKRTVMRWKSVRAMTAW